MQWSLIFPPCLLQCSYCMFASAWRDDGLLALRTTSIHFDKLGVTVNGQYLGKSRCRNFCQIFVSCQNFTCFNKTVCPPRARETVDLLETSDFIPSLRPPNTPDSHPVDNRVWSVMQKVNEVFRVSSQLGTNSRYWCSSHEVARAPVESSFVCYSERRTLWTQKPSQFEMFLLLTTDLAIPHISVKCYYFCLFVQGQ